MRRRLRIGRERRQTAESKGGIRVVVVHFQLARRGEDGEVSGRGIAVEGGLKVEGESGGSGGGSRERPEKLHFPEKKCENGGIKWHVQLQLLFLLMGVEIVYCCVESLVNRLTSHHVFCKKFVSLLLY